MYIYRAYAIELGVWAEIQWHALMQVTSACCIVHANGGGVVLTLCNLRWWSLSSTTVRMYSLAQAVV